MCAVMLIRLRDTYVRLLDFWLNHVGPESRPDCYLFSAKAGRSDINGSSSLSLTRPLNHDSREGASVKLSLENHSDPSSLSTAARRNKWPRSDIRPDSSPTAPPVTGYLDAPSALHVENTFLGKVRSDEDELGLYHPRPTQSDTDIKSVFYFAGSPTFNVRSFASVKICLRWHKFIFFPSAYTETR